MLKVEIANQKRIPVEQHCPQYVIEIAGYQFCVDLIPFKLGEFDVILGMDWLTKYDACIDCKSKKVILNSSDNHKVIFNGRRQTKEFLTMMQAK